MEILNREVVLKSLVGSHNYGLANEESDRDYKVFVSPTFEELYKGKQFSKSIVTPTEDNDIHDIRKLSDLLFKANINFLEVLASNESIIPDGNDEILKIYEMRNDIFKMNLPYLYNACWGMHLNKMKLLLKGTEGTQCLVDKYGYDTKQALHAYRVLKFIEDFEATNFEDFHGALRHSGDNLEFMLNIRHGGLTLDAFQNFIHHYREATFLHLAKRYGEFEANLELKAEIDVLIMQLIKRKIIESEK